LGLLNSEKACAVEVDKMASIDEKSVNQVIRFRRLRVRRPVRHTI
jgi:hypothetical protein